MIIMCFAFLLTACDSDNNTTETTNEANQVEQSIRTTNDVHSQGVGHNAMANACEFVENDLVFVFDGVEYPLHSDASKLLAALGKGYSLSEADSCAYVGMDRQFIYDSGIEIDTYPIKDKDIIDLIVITRGDFSTSKGITIGSSREDVEAAYGPTYKDEGDVMIYYQNNDFDNLKAHQLYFVIEGSVVEIGYYGASNVNSQSK